MNTFFEAGSSVVLSVLSPGIDHLARSPFRDGLLAASLVLVFMTVALLKPGWMR